MKPYFTIVAVFVLLISVISFTGFQCSSAELTSAKLYMQRSDWESAERSLAKETEKNPNNG